MQVVHFCSQDFGGAGIAAYRLHLGLLKLGVDSKFLVFDKKSKDDTVLVIPDYEFDYNVSCENKETYLSKRMNFLWQYWYELLKYFPNRPEGLEVFSDTKCSLDMKWIKEVQEADIINFHWVAGMINYENLPAAIKNKKLVWTLHDMNAFTGGCHYTGTCTNFKKECSKCPQLGSNDYYDRSNMIFHEKKKCYDQININIVSPSKWLCEQANQSTLFKKQNIENIPYGLPLDIFKVAQKKEVMLELNINSNKKIILFGAQYINNKRKGFSLLVDALNILSKQGITEILLLVFGDTSEEYKLPENFEVINLGAISSNEKLAKIYSLSDLYVLPSIEDNLPNTVLESIACGTPVVAFNIGGMKDMIVNSENGYLAQPFNTNDLANGIKKILFESDLKKMSQNCRRIAESKYDLAIQAKAYENKYKLLLSKKNGPNITVATSIAPVGLEKQKLAIKSWLKCGFKVVSLNSQEEIDQIKNDFPEVVFEKVSRNAKEFAGKPLIYFDDVLQYLWNTGEKICGIINSDIILNVDEKFLSYLNREVNNSLIYGSRADILNLEDSDASIYEFGFDYFFFNRELISLFPKSELCLGLPWWDYWMVAIPFLNNVRLKKIVSPIACHLWHETNYDNKFWLHFGKFFLEFLIDQKLLKLPKDYNFEDDYEKSNSYISLTFILLFLKNTDHLQFSPIKKFNLFPSIVKDEIILFKNILSNLQNINMNEYSSAKYYIENGLFKEAEIIFNDTYEKEKNNPSAILNLIIISLVNNKVRLVRSLVNKYLELTQDHNDVIDYYFKISPDHFLPAVSAIISTYNSEKFIAGCLDDLIGQTLYKQNKLEIIIIDSGSEENEGKIIKEYSSKYSNISYKRTEKESIYQAWNRGIQLAQGRYITNANTDDRHSKDALEKMSNFLDSNPDCALVYADVYRTNKPNDIFNSKNKKDAVSLMDFDSDLLHFNCYVGPQPLWRKSLHKKYGYFDENLKVVGDYEFWLKICKNEKFYHLNEVLGLYLYSIESAEHRNEILTKEENDSVQALYLIKYVKDVNDFNRIKMKLEIVSKYENLKQFSDDAYDLLNKRKDGIDIENKISLLMNEVNSKPVNDALTLLNTCLKEVEFTESYIDKNKYFEILNLYAGSLSLINQQTECAKSYFEKALNINPNSSEACFGLGEILFTEDNIEGSLTMFEYALKLDPDNVNAKKRIEELAPLKVENSEDDLSNDLIIFLNSINTLIEKNDFENSIKLLKQAQNHFSSEYVSSNLKSTFMSLVGFTLLGLSNIDEARKSFEESLQLNPECSEACRGLAEIFILNGMPDEAKTMLEWAIKNNPNNIAAANKLNELERSCLVTNEINALNKEQIFEKGYNLFADKKYSEVIELLYEAEELLDNDLNNENNKEFTSAFFNLKGFSYLALNLMEDAKKCFEYALQINSKSSKACLGLGEVFFIRKNYEAAKTMYEYSVLNDPDNAVANECLDKVNNLLLIEEDHNSILL